MGIVLNYTTMLGSPDMTEREYKSYDLSLMKLGIRIFDSSPSACGLIFCLSLLLRLVSFLLPLPFSVDTLQSFY